MKKLLSLVLVLTLVFSMFSFGTAYAASVVEVTRPLKGDADDDGEITDWDGMLFERYLAAWNV